MTNLLHIPNRLDSAAHSCRAIVETPQGQRCKFDYDPESGLFELHGVLPAGLAFPLAFGFIPSTLAEDGDPADILILADDVLPTGCLVEVKLLGVIAAEQTQDGNTLRNDRWVGRVAQSRQYADIEAVADLGEAFVRELERFFVTYNDLKGHRFEVLGVHGPDEACVMLAGLRARG